MKKCGMVKTYFAEVDYMEGIWIDWKLGTQVKRPANTTEVAEGRTGLSFIFSCDKYVSNPSIIPYCCYSRKETKPQWKHHFNY